jgi:hypothetical protein
MRAIEVSQALDVGEKRESDEVQGCNVSEIPLHVWQDEKTKGIRLWRRAEEYFLSFRSTRDDLLYPVMKT